MKQLNIHAIGFLCFVLFVFLQSCNNNEQDTYSIKKGEFKQSITETGELAAVNVKSFVMPRYGRYWYDMKITGLLEHGTIVHAGDSVLQFDPSEINKFIIGQETELEKQKANLEKKIVEISNRKSELNSNLLSEQASYDLKMLELETVKFESEKAKTVKQLEFEQAKIRLNKTKKSVEYNEIISRNDYNIQKIRVERLKKEIQNAYGVLDQLTIRTTIPGIFQIAKKRRSRELLKIGDEVWAGTKLGNVPDLTWMKVNTYVNEADFFKLHVGQKVNVKLDALNNVSFEGEISHMSKLCRNLERDSRQKVFDIEVKMIDSDERLKPGMTVSCEYIVAKLDDVFYVPLNCLEQGKTGNFIYIRDDGNTIKTSVKVGPSNNSHIVIDGNLKKGQRILPLNKLIEPEKN